MKNHYEHSLPIIGDSEASSPAIGKGFLEPRLRTCMLPKRSICDRSTRLHLCCSPCSASKMADVVCAQIFFLVKPILQATVSITSQIRVWFLKVRGTPRLSEIDTRGC